MKNNATILIVDDELNVREPLAAILRKKGYEAVTAGDGDEAVNRFVDQKPDLVILDLNLPIRSGWDVLAAIQGMAPAAPVILITARPGQYELAAAARVAALIEKPLDPDLFLRVMEGILAEPATTRITRFHHGFPLPQYWSSECEWAAPRRTAA